MIESQAAAAETNCHLAGKVRRAATVVRSGQMVSRPDVRVIVEGLQFEDLLWLFWIASIRVAVTVA